MASIEISVKYTLTGPDGTVVVFNDTSDPNYIGMLTDVTGLDSPDVRESADDLVQMDGGIHGDFWYSRRPITLTGLILNPASATDRNNKSNRLSQATNAMRGDAILTWTPTGGTLQQIAVRRQQPLRITGAWQKQFLISLVAADPRIYSDALHTSTVSGIIATNLVPTPSFGSTIGAWSGAIAAPITGGPSTLALGTNRMNVTTPSSAGLTGAWINFPAVSSGQVVTARVGIQVPTTQNMTVAMQDSGVGNGFVSATVSVPAGTSGSPTYLQVTWTPTADSPNPRLYIYQNSTTLAQTWFVNNAMVVYGTDVSFGFFDGNDPRGRWVGVANASSSELLTLSASGRAYNKSFNYSYGGGAPQGQILVTNTGNTVTYPILRVFGPGNNPILSNFTTGQQIALVTGLGAGDWMKIDTLNRLVLLNDTISRYGVVDFANTDWWGLVPGVNDLRYAFDTPLAGSSFRVDWRDASI